MDKSPQIMMVASGKYARSHVLALLHRRDWPLIVASFYCFVQDKCLFGRQLARVARNKTAVDFENQFKSLDVEYLEFKVNSTSFENINLPAKNLGYATMGYFKPS